MGNENNLKDPNPEEPITGDENHIIKTITLELPLFSKARRSSRMGKIGLLLRGGKVRVGRYDLEMHRRDNYTAITISPVSLKTRTFTRRGGQDVSHSDRMNFPRVRVQFTYFLWELVKGVHHKNTKLSLQLIRFLDKVKELLVE